MSSIPTQGRVGNTGAKDTVVSFPGREVEHWNELVNGRTPLNWAVVYDTTVPENPDLSDLIKKTTWETDDEEWDRVKALLEGAPWFQKWVANVHADSDKQLLVFCDRDGNFGNYQRAEIKWLREHGFFIPGHSCGPVVVVSLSYLQRMTRRHGDMFSPYR